MASSSSLGLGIVLSADSSAAVAGFQQFNKALGDTAKATAVQAAKMNLDLAKSIMGVGTGAMGGMIGAAKASGEFSQVMMRVGLISRASATDVKALSDAAINAGIATQFTPKDAAEGLKNLASQGFNAKDSMAALLPALDLAAGGGIGVEGAAVAMTSAIKVFRLNADQAGDVADKLLHIGHITHFEAKELENFMGTIGRGAGITKQSLEEMVIAGGLVRNTGTDMSVAASSVSAALVHMGQNAAHFKKLGVNVTDAKGEFRPFLDIVQEASAALDTRFPNAAERVAHAEKLFARFGLTAYSAISGQLGKGVHDAEGHIYKGTEAIKYLRREMDNAGGTAAKFRDKMLDSFAGASILLHGSIETFKVQFGEGFGAVLKPIVQFVTDALNKVLGFMRDLSPETKKTAAAIMMGAAALLSLGGALLVGALGFKLLAAGAAFAGITMSGLLFTILPIAAAFGAIGLLAAGIFVAFKGNVGGLGDIISGGGARIRLAFDAISMLFSRGGFTKKMWDSLNRPGEEGVLQFALHVYHWGGIIKNFMKSVWEGFKAAVEVARPAFQQLGSALWTVGEALGIVDKEFPVDAAGRWEKFGAAAKRAGEAFGKLAGILAKGLAVGINTAVTAASSLKKAWESQSDSLDSVVANYANMNASLEGIAKNLGIVTANTKASSYEWLTLDNVLGGLAAAGLALLKVGGEIAKMPLDIAIGMLRTLTDLLSGVWDVLGGLLEFVSGVFTGNWTEVWRGLGRIVYGVINGIVQAVLSLAQALGGVIGPLLKSLGMGDAVMEIEELKRDSESNFRRWFGQEGQITGAPHAGGAMWGALPRAPSAPGGMSIPEPGVGGMSLPLPASMSSPGANASTEQLHRDLQEVLAAIEESGKLTAVSIDGEVIARASQRARRANDVASFSSGVSFSSGE